MTTVTITKQNVASAFGYSVKDITMNIFGMFSHIPSGAELGVINNEAFKKDVVKRLRLIAKNENSAEKEELVQSAIAYMSGRFVDGKVFKNVTMPNVDIAGIRFYLILDTASGIDNNVALRFCHPHLDAIDLNELTSFEVKSPANNTDNSCLIAGAGVGIEQAVDMINEIAEITKNL